MSENNNARFLVAGLELPVAILPIFLFVRKTTITERERETSVTTVTSQTFSWSET